MSHSLSRHQNRRQQVEEAPVAGPEVVPGRRGRARLRAAWQWVGAWVATAPGSYIWLLILTVTALQFAQLPARTANVVLRVDSTNLSELFHHPVAVFILSALWTQTPSLLSYIALFHVFHIPLERWVGTARWLITVVSAHVGATLISQGTVWLAIRWGAAPAHMAHTLDVGVSYSLAGAAGLLGYRLTRPWRWVYFAVALAYLAAKVGIGQTFTDVGHLAALVIGMLFYRFTRGRPLWDPPQLARALAARIRTSRSRAQ
ncbi:hypothetical protein P3T37_002815 [Kitasatospora sp. MAA4]|uniref:rhomboid-like protein n=1 Tax=Kitasatospora sp. MAA4 TaxID=3035093 RepID=UPI002472F31A|nr:rhomboid-like protein [Kitasatospora sp. MAA4]MDH6133420.1 hypothetical protein [Kitasatospora sp. MAA4]